MCMLSAIAIGCLTLQLSGDLAHAFELVEPINGIMERESTREGTLNVAYHVF